jgi:hypothetical protein
MGVGRERARDHRRGETDRSQVRGPREDSASGAPNPLYWGDRLVRVLLGIPAYLVSVLLGTSFERVDRSAWGLPLRLVALVGEVITIAASARAIGLW